MNYLKLGAKFLLVTGHYEVSELEVSFAILAGLFGDVSRSPVFHISRSLLPLSVW